MSEKPHRRLDVWKEAINLVEISYKLSESFPHKEQFGLTAQLRRAAVSVPANIAEGSGRYSAREKINFFRIARGSLSELDTHIEIAGRLSYIQPKSQADIVKLMERVSRMLQGLINSVDIRMSPNRPMP